VGDWDQLFAEMASSFVDDISQNGEYVNDSQLMMA
jgi:hypothetical protein